MFNVGPGELIMLMVLALIVFGPQKLPEIFGTVGRTIAEFRRASQELTDVFQTEMEAVQSQVQSFGTSVESSLNEVSSAVQSPIDEAASALSGATARPVPEGAGSDTAVAADSRVPAPAEGPSQPVAPETPPEPVSPYIPVNTYPAATPLERHRPPAVMARATTAPPAPKLPRYYFTRPQLWPDPPRRPAPRPPEPAPALEPAPVVKATPETTAAVPAGVGFDLSVDTPMEASVGATAAALEATDTAEGTVAATAAGGPAPTGEVGELVATPDGGPSEQTGTVGAAEVAATATEGGEGVASTPAGSEVAERQRANGRGRRRGRARAAVGEAEAGA